jgi:hypothetical protein
MEHSKIDELVARIKALESELEEELHQEYERFTCEITKKREEILASYQHDREGLFRYLATTPILHLLSAPIIWSVLIPALILDGFVMLYQSICFPIYKIAKVKRRDYIVFDRHRLGYLNPIEKLNCLYCSYFNGLMGYISEIAARTEQYWCPIRHASRVKSIHSRYQKFFEYGESARFRSEAENLRNALTEEKE